MTSLEYGTPAGLSELADQATIKGMGSIASQLLVLLKNTCLQCISGQDEGIC